MTKEAQEGKLGVVCRGGYVVTISLRFFKKKKVFSEWIESFSFDQ